MEKIMRAIAAIREFKLTCGDAFILGLVIGLLPSLLILFHVLKYGL
jgi:uncharacterized membrane protein YheB (UPF0754 family)